MHPSFPATSSTLFIAMTGFLATSSVQALAQNGRSSLVRENELVSPQISLSPRSTEPHSQIPLYKPAPLSGRFLQITDIHLDPHYKAGSTEKSMCHAPPVKQLQHSRNRPSEIGEFGAPNSNCDSPFLLVNETFRFVREVLAGKDRSNLDFVIWTGDNARHGSKLNLRSENDVRNLNKIITDYIIEAFPLRNDSSGQPRSSVPVVASIGNNDIHPHNRLNYSEKADIPILNYLADIWKPFIPESQDAIFRHIGSYVVDLVPDKLWGVSLNTMYLASYNIDVPDCRRGKTSRHHQHDHGDGGHGSEKVSDNGPTSTRDTGPTPGDKVMSWLENDVLIPARQRNIAVYITGHIPPNIANYGIGCYSEFSRLSIEYRDVIQGQFYGHMNIDHFYFTTPYQVLANDKDAYVPKKDTMPIVDGDERWRVRIDNNDGTGNLGGSKTKDKSDGENESNDRDHKKHDTDKKQKSKPNPAAAIAMSRFSALVELFKVPVRVASPAWVSLYFEYLILHFKSLVESTNLPFPILVGPSVVPSSNPALRVYLYDTRQHGSVSSTSEKGDSEHTAKKHNGIVFGSLTNYEQYYCDLRYWNRLVDHGDITIKGGYFVVNDTTTSESGEQGVSKIPKHIYEFEYNAKSRYGMKRDAIDTEAWFNLAMRLAGSVFETPDDFLRKRHALHRSNRDDVDRDDDFYSNRDEDDDNDRDEDGDEDDDEDDRHLREDRGSYDRDDMASTYRKAIRGTHALRQTFYRSMLVHLADLGNAFPYGMGHWKTK